MNLKIKFLIIFGSLLVVSIVITGWIIFYQVSTITVSQLEEDRLAALNIRVSLFEQHIETYKNRLRLITELPLIKKFSDSFYDTTSSEDKIKNKLGIEQVFKEIIKNDPNIYKIRYIDKDGNEIISLKNENGSIFSVPDTELQNQKFSSYFIDTMKNKDVYVSDIELNEEFGKIIIPYISVVRFGIIATDSLDQETGVIILNTNVNNFLKETGIISQGDLIIINNEGDVKLHPDADLLFGNQLGTNYSFFTYSPTIRQNLQNEEMHTVHDYEKQEYRIWQKVYYSEDLNRYWILINRISEAELFKPINDAQITFVGIIILILSIVIIIIILVTRNIVKPINSLTELTSKISSGDYETTIHRQKGNDEISKLVNNFKMMLESLKQSKIIISETNNELEKKINELTESDKLKEEFASMVTHELKTPLTPIKGYCEMLKDPDFGQLTSEQLTNVDEIYRNAIRLETLIVDILDSQKLDMGKMKFNKTNFKASEFLGEAEKDLASLGKNKNIVLITNKKIDSMIYADRGRLRQVLDNLIKNAIDFVSNDTGKIEIGATQVNKHVEFYVKDNGIGIPKNKQSELFQKFYQVDTSLIRKHGGTGLGLVICKGIVEAHGGEIWLSSEEGNGCTFYFSIPNKEQP